MPRLPAEPVEPFWRPANGSRCDGIATVIGTDYYNNAMAFVAADDGVVRYNHLEGLLPSRFVNSSLDQFAAFMTVIPVRRRALIDLDDDEAVRQLDNLVAELQLVDGAALSQAETYWSVVVDQLRVGLL